jgi:hypothetical protein
VWQFGPYRVEQLIARGGMGEVLRAYDTRHDRLVALKLLHESIALDESFRERFKREAHAVARLREPHVIPIHAYGEIDGRLYLDMRLVDGEDVSTLLARERALSPEWVLDVLGQVADALDAAHAEGLVHRDVKPSNILISRTGFAYLVDFGITYSMGVAERGLTSTGSAVGTVDYMAPERFTAGAVDQRADVYSLACVLYQCVTGEKPFAGETVLALAHAHLSEPPPVASSRVRGLPRALDEVIACGMAKDPGGRFTSARALINAAWGALRSPAATAVQPAYMPLPTGSVPSGSVPSASGPAGTGLGWAGRAAEAFRCRVLGMDRGGDPVGGRAGRWCRLLLHPRPVDGRRQRAGGRVVAADSDRAGVSVHCDQTGADVDGDQDGADDRGDRHAADGRRSWSGHADEHPGVRRECGGDRRLGGGPVLVLLAGAGGPAGVPRLVVPARANNRVYVVAAADAGRQRHLFCLLWTILECGRGVCAAGGHRR